MPKKSRQAHIPQQVRRRKARRPNLSSPPVYQEPEAPSFVDEPVLVAPGLQSAGPVVARPGRRLEQLTSAREGGAPRVTAGQLPLIDRAYLIDELRRIALISGSLLTFIVVLAIVFR
jgi:hypothetical protein